jgi:hypothetical protein
MTVWDWGDHVVKISVRKEYAKAVRPKSGNSLGNVAISEQIVLPSAVTSSRIRRPVNW